MPVVRICATRTPQTPYSTLPLKKPKDEGDPFLSSDGKSWHRVCCLGRGGFGAVYLANTQETQYRLPYQIAVKSSLFSKSAYLQYEKAVLSDLKNCPYVIKCYGEEVTETSGGDQVYNLLLEYCSGLSVGRQIKKMGRLSEEVVRSYTRDVVRGLKYIHGSMYAHCDVKPDNILLVPSTSSDCGFAAKIADFGLAREIEDDMEVHWEEVGGTSCYMSPELIEEKKIDYPVDIWALGISIVEMLNGEAAWESSDSDSDQLIQLNSGDIEWRSSLVPISDDCKDFISKCLARNVADRWTARKLLKHPFLR